MRVFRLSLAAFFLTGLIACGKGEKSEGGPSNDGQVTFSKADFPNEPGTAFGGWQARDYDRSSGADIYIEFYFNRSGEMGLNVRCVKGTDDIPVSTKGPVEVTDRQIRIKAALSAINRSKPGTYLKDCKVDVPAIDFDYSVLGNSLRLRHTSANITMTRIAY